MLRYQRYLLVITDSFEKAEILNNQFHLYTNENLSDIPTPEFLHPSMPNVSFSTEGIFKLLCELDITKSPGPDAIPSIVLTHCAAQIAPILQVIFTQSMSTGIILGTGLLQMLHQFLRRMNGAIHLPQFVVKLWSMSFTTQSWNLCKQHQILNQRSHISGLL